MGRSDGLAELAERIGAEAQRHGARIAVAESLTGGSLSARLAAASGASDWYCGAVVAYTPEAKQRALDVRPGPVVSPECARQMAEGARRALGADLAVAVTGVGGPGPEEGQPPGTVWLGLAGRGATAAFRHRFAGDSDAIVGATIRVALERLLDRLDPSGDQGDADHEEVDQGEAAGTSRGGDGNPVIGERAPGGTS